MDRPFERVYTVVDYYDGPRLGIADLDGTPHVYRSLWLDSADEWDAVRFELAPLSSEGLAVALEDWAIWRRFERAYRAGEVGWSGDEREWGALPEDRARHEELRPALDRALTIDGARRLVARGEFRPHGPRPADASPGVMRDLEVRWTPAE
jgi:hypothetical protein